MPAYNTALRSFARYQLPIWCAIIYATSLLQAGLLQLYPRASWLRSALLGNDKATFAILAPTLLIFAAISLAGLVPALHGVLGVLQVLWKIVLRSVPDFMTGYVL